VADVVGRFGDEADVGDPRIVDEAYVDSARTDDPTQRHIIRTLAHTATHVYKCRSASEINAVVLLVNAFVDPDPAWKTASFICDTWSSMPSMSWIQRLHPATPSHLDGL
jgi:hypothetical protein